MKRLLPILALCSLLSCELASLLRMGLGAPMSCGAPENTGCSVSESCTITTCDVTAGCDATQQEKPCGKDKKDCPRPCVPCSPNCCVFLVPEYGFILCPPPDAAVEKPQGKQDQYSHPFASAVWHPPAPLV